MFQVDMDDVDSYTSSLWLKKGDTKAVFIPANSCPSGSQNTAGPPASRLAAVDGDSLKTAVCSMALGLQNS